MTESDEENNSKKSYAEIVEGNVQKWNDKTIHKDATSMDKVQWKDKK